MENYTPAPDKVTLFGLSYCPYSKGARVYLARRGVDFIYVEVDCLYGREKQAVGAFLASLSPSGALPVILIGAAGPANVGYDPKKLQLALPLMPLKHPAEKAEAPARAGVPATLIKAAKSAVEKGRHPSAILQAAKGAVFKPQPEKKRKPVAARRKPGDTA